MVELPAKKNSKRDNICDIFVDCRFILAFITEIERLWSRAKHILTDVRKDSSPVTVEAMLFLNANTNY